MRVPSWLRSNEAPLVAEAQRREYRAMVARITADGNARVLDWGCGLGQVTDLLTRAGLNVDAFDFGGDQAPDALTELPYFPNVAAYISSDPVKLPYSDGVFDAVLSCGVLEHVQDPHGSLEEIKRVLKPGGMLYVYKLPNERSYLEWIARRIGLDYHGQHQYDRLYTLESARALLVQHGYAISEVRYANMLPLTLSGRVANRLGALVWSASRLLSALPGLRRFATNVETIARAPA
jgi:ubiquinone/menaquinone biosynthesis C-methylase UbiE